MTGKIKTANYKSFLAFQVLVGLFLNFRKIEPTVSYKLFLIKKIRVQVHGYRIMHAQMRVVVRKRE